MNDLHTVNAIGTLLEELGHEEALRRLRGAASPPETGSRTRVAGSKPGDPQDTTSELPFADQAEPWLGEAYRQLGDEAAAAFAGARRLRDFGVGHWGTFDRAYAAGLVRALRIFSRLAAMSEAQSEGNEGEPCGSCGQNTDRIDKAAGYCTRCGAPIPHGEPEGASGSANAELRDRSGGGTPPQDQPTNLP